MLKSDISVDDKLISIGELPFLPERTCAICYQDQNSSTTFENKIITISSASEGVVGSAQTYMINPTETISCDCVYYFVCIANRLEIKEDEG